MPQVHTVKQGETLTRIARQYKYSSWKTIYNHESNEEFRKLRPDANLIYPGDEITIPDIVPKKMSASTARTHIFCLKKEKEYFRMQIESNAGGAWEGKRVALSVAGQTIDSTLGPDGKIEIELPDEYDDSGTLEIYLDDESDTASHEFEVKVAHLDPVDTLSGVQARCNALGYECGVVDGVMGNNTREGVEAFQYEYGLEVDGEPGPITQAKLTEVYGF